MEKANMVLLADDEEFIRKLGKKILSIEGFIMLEADNGERAVELYKDNHKKIAVVILDIRMPGKSGIDVLRYITAVNPAARVILCSGYGEDMVMSEGCSFFIQKPFSVEAFRQSVQRVLLCDEEKIRQNNETILKNSTFNIKPEDGLESDIQI